MKAGDENGRRKEKKEKERRRTAKLSREERKKREREYWHEYFRRKGKEYLELSPEVILAEAQVHATLYSILAGLMFTASVLFFSFGRELVYGDIFAMITLTDTFFFVFGAMLTDMYSESARRGDMYDAYNYYAISSTFGTIGVFLMMANLPVMAFYLRWELGVVLCIVIALSIAYFFYRTAKRHVTNIIVLR
ncbi:MAG: hypothetical protein ACE5KD_04300 [Candidatus Bathyarchaeia archaeon]